MNPNKILATITDQNQIALYKKASISNFLFPLKDFCVGFPKTFTINEIPEGYLLINRILDTTSYQKLKEIFQTIPSSIKGILFEDFGVITLANELKLTQQRILYQSHFATNYQSINANLEYVDSVVIGTDITQEEIKIIQENTKKPLVFLLYGLVPTMYSRRTLLTNFQKEFHTPTKNILKLEEQGTKKGLLAVENPYGTMLYHEKYLNAQGSISDKNILFYLINPLFFQEEQLEQLIQDLLNQNLRHETYEDQGFLNQKTIYSLKEKENE